MKPLPFPIFILPLLGIALLVNPAGAKPAHDAPVQKPGTVPRAFETKGGTPFSLKAVQGEKVQRHLGLVAELDVPGTERDYITVKTGPDDASKAVGLDLNNPGILNEILAQSVDDLLMKKVGDVELAHAPNTDTPYTGWFKGFHENGRKRLLIHFKAGREDGPFVFWNENGIKTRQGSFRQGLFHGPYERWDSEGRKMFKGEYRYGFIFNDIGWKPNGEQSETNLVEGSGHYVEYYESGRKKWESRFKDGLAASVVIWKPNGEKCPDSNIVNGNGIFIHYNEDGTVAGQYVDRRIIGPVEGGRRIKTAQIGNGRLLGLRHLEVDKKARNPAKAPVRLTDEEDLQDPKFLAALLEEARNKKELHLRARDSLLMDFDSGTPYSGWVSESRGDGLALGHYKSGKPEGYLLMWDSKGQIRGWSQNIDGKKEGLWIVWREDGKKKEEINYKNGEPHGRVTLWHTNGRKMREGFYDEGEKVGVHTEWHRNGNKKLEMKLGQNDSFVRTEWDENGKETKRFKVAEANSATPRKFIWDGKRYVDDDVEVSVQLPVDARNQSLTQSTGNLAKINIRKNGAYVILGKQVTEEQIQVWLTGEFEKNPDLKVLIRADREAKHLFLTNVISICRKVGVPQTNIGVITERSSKGEGNPPSKPFVLDPEQHDPGVLKHYQDHAGFYQLGKPADIPADLDWQDGSEQKEFASPEAQRGGTFNSFMSGFPHTLRFVGPDANGAFRAHILDNNAINLLMGHPNTDGYYPGLARQWAVSGDGRTVYFRLNPAARYSDGKPVRATDFFYHFYFVRSPHIKAPWYNDYFSDTKFKRITLYDAQTISLTYYKATPDILDKLIIRPVPEHFYGVLDEDYLKDFQWKLEPTTGAYEVKPENVRHRTSITLTRVPGWWADKKKFFRHRFNPDAIKVILIPSRESTLAPFRQGELDLHQLSNPELWHEKFTENDPLVQAGYIQKVQFYNGIPQPTWALRLNSSRPPLDNRDVRIGLHYAMNWDRVLKEVFRGDYVQMNTVADGYGPRTHPTLRARKFSVEKAQEHFAKAGFKERGADGILKNADGKRLAFTLTTGYRRFKEVLSILKNEAKKAGVEINIELLEMTAGWKKSSEKKHEITLGALNTSVEMFPRFWESYHSDNAYSEPRNRRYDGEGKLRPGLTPKPNTNNTTVTADPEIDALIDKYRTATNVDERTLLAHQLAEKLHDHAAYIPGWKRPWYRVGHWRWLRFPEGFNVKESRSPTEFHVHWIDAEIKTATLKAKAQGRKFNPLPVAIHDQFKVEEKNNQAISPGANDTAALTAEDIERIAAQPHQPIAPNPQFVSAALKPGMWLRISTFEYQKTPEREARVIGRKTIKKIKHVQGKYVVIETTDKGVKVSIEVHSYDPKTNTMRSTYLEGKGILSELDGVPNPKTRTIKWKSVPTENDPRALQLTLTCAEDGLSARVQGRVRREGTLLSTITGELKRIGDLPESDLAPVRINIRKSGAYIVLDEQITRGQLEAWLSEELKEKPDLKVLIRADRETNPFDLINLVSICRKIGVSRTNIAVATEAEAPAFVPSP